MYSVLFFGSHPDNNNDDCWTGRDFETYAEALAFYNDPWADAKFTQYFCKSTAFIEITGDENNYCRCRPNPLFKPSKREEIREDAHDLSRLDHDYSYESNMPYGYGEENR